MPHADHSETVKRKRSHPKSREQRTASPDRSESDTHDLESEEQEGGDKKRVRWNGSFDERDCSDDNGEENKSAETDLPEICLSMSCHHGRLGGAYFDPLKTTLYLLEDTTESAHFDITQMLLEQASPNAVITSSKSDEKFIDAIRDLTDSTSTSFQIRPNREFNPSKGREQLLTLRLFSTLHYASAGVHTSSDTENDSNDSGDTRNAYDFMRKRRAEDGDPGLQRWNATIRLSNFSTIEASPYCISAAGALLDHMARARAAGELEDEGIGGLDIRFIESLALNRIMHINADALSSLQIFENEGHASIYSDKTKEGNSLFGILNSTRTSLGRRLLRDWFLRPSLSLSTITSRHDALSCFLRPENLTTANTMHAHLKGIGNVPHVFALLRAGKARAQDWQSVLKFVYHVSLLREAVSELNQGSHVDVIKKLVKTLDIASFRDMGNAVHGTIDWEESSNAGRVCVRPHVDEELDKWKRIFHGLDSVLSRVAAQLSVPTDYAESLNVVYFPQLGFLICVPLRDEWRNEEGTHVPQPPSDDFVFQFCTERSAYFKSPQMQDLDHHIGDLHPAIVDREIEIIHILEEKVIALDGIVAAACDACAELDCLLSFAEASRTFEYTRPYMVDGTIIDIEGGRHPLQETLVDTFVPNDTYMMGGVRLDSSLNEYIATDDGSDASGRHLAKSVIVCTGANACGKSVYLKQTALIVYMAQIGCFVPAKSATLGIVDKIFTRIQTRESVSRVQSAFMIDLNQVSLALRNLTAHSLLIIDEFGKGTISSDGAGLFCGLLTHLLSLGPSCPKVIAATHFHDLFREDLLSPSLPISFVHMQVLLTSSRGEILDSEALKEEANEAQEGQRLVAPGESITYLYRVAQGLCLDSYASKCALAYGIAPRLVQRAQHVSDLLSTHAIGTLLDEGMTPKEQADLEDAEAVCRRFLEWDLRTDHDDGRDAKGWLRHILGRSEAEEGGESDIFGE